MYLKHVIAFIVIQIFVTQEDNLILWNAVTV